MIAFSDLIHGQYYWGDSRNTRTARWNADESCFVYIRTCPVTAARVVQVIPHFEIDDSDDFFVPEKPVDWGTDFIPLDP